MQSTRRPVRGCGGKAESRHHPAPGGKRTKGNPRPRHQGGAAQLPSVRLCTRRRCEDTDLKPQGDLGRDRTTGIDVTYKMEGLLLSKAGGPSGTQWHAVGGCGSITGVTV